MTELPFGILVGGLEWTRKMSEHPPMVIEAEQDRGRRVHHEELQLVR